MPTIFHAPISRKQFLQVSTGMLGAMTVGVLSRTSHANDSDKPDVFQLALLSDTHIPQNPAETYRGFAPTENLAKVVVGVRAWAPAGAIINGDAARLAGYREDYQQLQKLLTPLADSTPVYIGLGNHDDRKNFFEVFEKADPSEIAQKVNGKHVLVVEHPHVRTIVLDSLLYVDRTAGLLGKSQREWLARYLTEADSRPTVLFVHHSLGDGDGELLDVERLFRIVEPHKNVKAIFYGHSHRYRIERRGGLTLVNLPATGYNFGDSEPVGWIAAEFDPAGVNLTLHAVGGNQADHGKTSRVDW